MAETGRERWSVRVEKWQQSGLSARDFAAQAGLNAGTLCYWKWRLAREARRPASAPRARKRRDDAVNLVELAPVSLNDERVEVELSSGHRLHVPARFDADALARLVSILGGQS
jgi:hypothetical protein